MRMPLLSGEQLIKEGFANLQRGWEALGGRLYLTNQRLIFESHPFNIQREALLFLYRVFWGCESAGQSS